MNDDFAASLLRAIGEFIATVAEPIPMTGFESDSMWTRSMQGMTQPPSTMAVPQNHGIQSIKKTDPGFDLQAFLLHVGEMFSAYHEALDKGDLKPVRRFVDESSYPALEEAANRSGRSPVGVRALHVKAIRPMTAQHDDGLDLVRVLISAGQDGSPEPICEYWELIRKTGVVTKPGLTITKCPNCGGPVDGLDPTRCAYCGTRLADPALDWVVRKIMPQ